MLTDIKKAEKTGQGMNAALEQLDESIDKLQSTKEAFEACIKLGNTQPLEEMMLAESTNQPSQTEMMAMLEEMMSDGMDPNDLADMFGMADDDFGFDDEGPVDAKFKEGMSVKIAKNVVDEDSGLPIGTLQGRVLSAYYEDDLGEEIFYDISLDSISLNKLPLHYVEKMVSWKKISKILRYRKAS